MTFPGEPLLDASLIREPMRRTFTLPDGEMAALDFGDPMRPVDVLFVHANGFNAMTYRQVLQPLSSALRIVAVDLRGHGRTRLPADPAQHRNWNVFADDLLRVIEALNSPQIILAGHSMGATSCILAAGRSRGQVKALTLFEPVLLPRLQVWMSRLPGAQASMLRRFPLARQALARRSLFKDRAEALASYSGRGAFKTWPEASVADYVVDGLRDRDDGAVELACAPAWEAANYTAQGADPHAALARIRVPVRIFKAERHSTCRVEAGRIGRPNVTVEVVPGASHFLPMERADLVRAALLDAAEAG